MIFVRSRERAWAGGRSLAEMRNEVLMEVLKTVRAPANTLTRLQPVSVRLYRVPADGGRRANKSGSQRDYSRKVTPAACSDAAGV